MEADAEEMRGIIADLQKSRAAQAKRIAELAHSLALAHRQVDNMAGVLRQLIEAHEDADSGADIPLHIYKQAQAACPPV